MPALRNKIRVREKRKDSVKSEVASRLQEGHRPESRRNSFAVLVSFHCLLFSLSLFFSDRATLRGRRREARKGGIEFRDSRLGSRRIYPGSSREEALGRRPRISIARKEKRRRRGIEEGRKKENRSTFRSRCHSAERSNFRDCGSARYSQDASKRAQSPPFIISRLVCVRESVSAET